MSTRVLVLFICLSSFTNVHIWKVTCYIHTGAPHSFLPAFPVVELTAILMLYPFGTFCNVRHIGLMTQSLIAVITSLVSDHYFGVNIC